MGDEFICDLDGVRASEDDFPVQLIRAESTGRAMVRAVNEGGFACTDVDLLDLLAWLHRIAPKGVNLDELSVALAALAAGKRVD